MTACCESAARSRSKRLAEKRRSPLRPKPTQPAHVAGESDWRPARRGNSAGGTEVVADFALTIINTEMEQRLDDAERNIALLTSRCRLDGVRTAAAHATRFDRDRGRGRVVEPRLPHSAKTACPAAGVGPSSTLTPANTRPYHGSMHRRTRNQDDRTNGAPPLTKRQTQVVSLLATGKSTREVARAIGVAPRTVQVHIGMIMKKLGVASRLQVVALALRDKRKAEGSKSVPWRGQ